jgi:hypothetical protein
MKRQSGSSAKPRPRNSTGKRSKSTPSSSRTGGSKPAGTPRSRGSRKPAPVSSQSSRSGKATGAGSTRSDKKLPASVRPTTPARGSRPTSGKRSSAKTHSSKSTPTPIECAAEHSRQNKLRQAGKKICGQQPKVVGFDGAEATSWLLPAGQPAGLLIHWVVDGNRYGRYCLTLLGCEETEVPLKPLQQGALLPAFFGEVSVRGAGRNDLFASYGYEDPDVLNEDNVVVNKPQTVVLSPKRKD